MPRVLVLARMTALKMADLESLIRVRRHTVEEKQKILGAIYAQVEEIENRKKELFARLEKERKALDDDLNLETREYFGRFQGVIQNNVEKLDVELVELEARLEIVQEEVRTAFAEQKRVEIVHERRQEEERREINNKESRELDEIGVEGFRRKEEF